MTVGLPALLVVALSAAAICAILIVLLRPLLQRYALARPNARSSHKVPTPQGGGLAIVGACLTAASLSPMLGGPALPLTLLGAAVLLAAVGTIDDLKPLPVLPRMALQALAVALVLWTLPTSIHILSPLPIALERIIEFLGLIWFINLTNFMDGLDWMTVAEMLPITVMLSLFAFIGEAPAAVAPVALGLAGALLGFAPFNAPVARLFMGDVGSLPIGLLVGWALVAFAGDGHLAAALLLPLYYLADATLTLLARLRRGEKIWVAHRTHFYQRATDNGFTVREVVGTVFALNIALAMLAGLSIGLRSAIADVALLAAGAAAVTAVLRRFDRGTTRSASRPDRNRT
jgi:UDP-N-acetylmuramyl pentapeptide phosphotransferase/UDP-N-acetylglucosamine-1-phosphate transferase